MGIDILSYILGRGKGGGGSGGGGSGAAQKNINFIDYDGTILYSYTTAEFATLTAMPENPSHAGLTAQGWNWTLEKAKAYAAKYGNLWIGQMYITDDGKTRVYIRLEEGRLEPYLSIGVKGTAVIEWGDGATDTISGVTATSVIHTQHAYRAPGEYVITVDVNATGSLGIVGDNSAGSRLLWKYGSMGYTLSNVYQSAVQKVEIGRNVSIATYAFKNCYNLTTITIPESVTSISSEAFKNCYSLTTITIPKNVTIIASSTFDNCNSLKSITIPESVTIIGGSAFQSCYSLTTITIPESVTSIGTRTFMNCYSLTTMTIPKNMTSIGELAFGNCHSLKSITIPESVTSIGGSAFQSCYSLTTITIPESVTSIGSNNTFINCYSLTTITIPKNVMSIGARTFSSCYGLGFIRFTATTPPAVSSIDAWLNIPTDCIIYVPSGTLAAYTSAANYPSSSSYTYVEY